MSSMSSVEKKRLRDRRAQQALRDKKLRHVTRLEQQVAYCEQYHSGHKVDELLREVQALRAENAVLRSRQERLKCLVRSWDIDATDTNWNDATADQEYATNLHTHEEIIPACTVDPVTLEAVESSNYTDPFSRPAGPAFTPLPLLDNDTEPCLSWSLLPLNDDDFSTPWSVSCEWFARPELIAQSPDTPASPLDLLYGSKINPLANMICTSLRRFSFREAERLALGWNNYHVAKWLVSPNPVTYSKISEFMKPVWGQVQMVHPMCLDLITWPKVRIYLIRRWQLYREHKDDIFRMLASCVRLRWPTEECILERNEDNELCLKPSFYETFMDEKCWALTSEFIKCYPEVVAGANMQSLVDEMC
ncbi:hypothetical protein HFD88_004245 [Aspergillus terreus]|nr:hypothetical protein HFD88_004245 [Aspergillus terreus]